MTLQSNRSAMNLKLIMNSANMPVIPADLVDLKARQIRQSNASCRRVIEISISRRSETSGVRNTVGIAPTKVG
jgi:hypothetical protein